MGLQDSLSRLKERLADHPHNYRPSILSFLELDTKKIAKDLRLAARGNERGKKNEPPADSEAFDALENEAIEFIEGELKKAHATALEELSTYAQRLYALDLEGRFSTIEAAALDGISSFRSKASQGLDNLSLHGRRLRERAQEMRDFKAENRLRRAAHYPTSGGRFWQRGLIALLFLLEVAGNSYFLGKGSAYGLIGGFIEAMLVAFLNLGVSIALGTFGVRQIWHRAMWRKAGGIVLLFAWLVFAVGFNLFVAHYREAAGAFLEGGGAIALQALKADPIGLSDFQSWVLFGVGALFAFIASVDAIAMDDPYPRYGKLDRAFEHARAEYADERHALIDELSDTKDAAVDAMLEAREDLGKRRGEQASILEGRARVLHGYEQHVTYLERVANSLLSIYREANRETRQDSGPARFNKAWSVIRPPIDHGPPPGTLPADRLEAEVNRAQASLDARMREVHAEFERAFTSYRTLDDVAGERDG